MRVAIAFAVYPFLMLLSLHLFFPMPYKGTVLTHFPAWLARRELFVSFLSTCMLGVSSCFMDLHIIPGALLCPEMSSPRLLLQSVDFGNVTHTHHRMLLILQPQSIVGDFLTQNIRSGGVGRALFFVCRGGWRYALGAELALSREAFQEGLSKS